MIARSSKAWAKPDRARSPRRRSRTARSRRRPGASAAQRLNTPRQLAGARRSGRSDPDWRPGEARGRQQHVPVAFRRGRPVEDGDVEPSPREQRRADGARGSASRGSQTSCIQTSECVRLRRGAAGGGRDHAEPHHVLHESGVVHVRRSHGGRAPLAWGATFGRCAGHQPLPHFRKSACHGSAISAVASPADNCAASKRNANGLA